MTMLGNVTLKLNPKRILMAPGKIRALLSPGKTRGL
jgi:hypothetical protein